MSIHHLAAAVLAAVCMSGPGQGAVGGRSDTDLEESLAGKPPYRRLFLDAMVVEESEGLKRVFHSATKHEQNPVVPCDRVWEGWGPYIYGTVMWDGGRLRMWYQCLAPEDRLRSRACYAESADGLKWTKPELGIVEHGGSKANNIFGEQVCAIPSVIRVAYPESADRAWAVYSYGGEAGAHVAFSADGLTWRWHEDPSYQKLFGTSDVVNFFYDPMRGRYTCTYKTPNRRNRAVGVAVSTDGIVWAKPVEGAVFGADDLDPDATQVYGMPVFPYQGVYIGLPWIYHARLFKYGAYTIPKMHEAQSDSARTVDVQFAWSWDLINWTRPPERRPFIGLGPEDAFDSKMIYTARAPVIVGDELYFYYGGFNRIHDDFDGVKGAIGLATLRLDGFCSMRAGEDEGWLISRRERFRTPRVTVNAKTAPDGYVVAELLDRNNNVLPGFSRAECEAFTGDSVRAEIGWKTKAFSPDQVDADKKVRFYIKNADLYSYIPADVDVEAQ